MTNQTKQELINLPRRERFDGDGGWWPRLLIVPMGRRDEDGYKRFYIIGANADGVGKIRLAYCGLVRFPAQMPRYEDDKNIGDLELDVYPSGIISLYSRSYGLSIMAEMSTADIITRKRTHKVRSTGWVYDRFENEEA